MHHSHQQNSAPGKAVSTVCQKDVQSAPRRLAHGATFRSRAAPSWRRKIERSKDRRKIVPSADVLAALSPGAGPPATPSPGAGAIGTLAPTAGTVATLAPRASAVISRPSAPVTGVTRAAGATGAAGATPFRVRSGIGARKAGRRRGRRQRRRPGGSGGKPGRRSAPPGETSC